MSDDRYQSGIRFEELVHNHLINAGATVLHVSCRRNRPEFVYKEAAAEVRKAERLIGVAAPDLLVCNLPDCVTHWGECTFMKKGPWTNDRGDTILGLHASKVGRLRAIDELFAFPIWLYFGLPHEADNCDIYRVSLMHFLSAGWHSDQWYSLRLAETDLMATVPIVSAQDSIQLAA